MAGRTRRKQRPGKPAMPGGFLCPQCCTTHPTTDADVVRRRDGRVVKVCTVCAARLIRLGLAS